MDGWKYVAIQHKYYAHGSKWVFIIMDNLSIYSRDKEVPTSEAMERVQEFNNENAYIFVGVFKSESDAVEALMRKHIVRTTRFDI